MKLASFEAIVKALEKAGVKYLVAGGLAVNAHGYLRFTKDADFVIQLIPENIIASFTALAELGYKPLIPVTAQQFSDAELRESWVRDKGMQVLQLWSDKHEETPIDIFASEPFPFEDEYQRALVKTMYGKTEVRFVSIPTLIAMKNLAGRPQDQIDIEQLQIRLKDEQQG